MTKENKPLFANYVSIGQGKGIRYTLWPTSSGLGYVRLERKEKTNGTWETKETFGLNLKALRAFALDAPHISRILSDMRQQAFDAMTNDKQEIKA